MTDLILRYYQEKAIVEGVWQYFTENSGNPLLVLPTASGKSLVIAALIKRILADDPDARIIVLAHVAELIAQNYAELIGHWPDAPAGIYSAGLAKRDLKSRIIFAGIQSIHRKAYNLQRIDIVIVDEAHLITRSGTATYRKFLDDLRQINPYLKIIGATATPFRLDSGLLHEGDDAMFSDISYEIGVRELIDGGFICTPTSKPAVAQIDTSEVGSRGGEFIAGQLEAVATHPETVEAVADEIIAHSQGRRGALIFGAGIEHCGMLKAAIQARGKSCEAIFGDTPNGERAALIAAFKAQRIWSLVSCGTLTTGFNAKHVDLVACVRPTKSLGLWIQIVGRGFRLFPGKDDFLVLDFGGNIARHGPIDDPRVRDKFKRPDPEAEKPTMPVRTCDGCGERSPISARFCRGCGEAFPDPVTMVSTEAAQFDIISSAAPQWLGVTMVGYTRHQKPGKPDSLCVSYWCGNRRYREWIALEHDGYAKSKAAAWWQKRAPGTQVPVDVTEALANAKALSAPTKILVKTTGAFPEIVGVGF